MPFQKLQFRPGINRETTSYANEGGWYDADKVRFRFGTPEKIGGWEKASGTFFLGTCRALHPWIALDGTNYVGTGTHLKYYINEGGGYNDITPIRETTSAGAVTFQAAASTLSSTITAADTSLTVASGTNFPANGGVIKIGSEIIRYAAKSSNVLSGLVRGFDDTTAAAHSSSAAVTCATVSVTDTAHGALKNDFVTFSGAATLGGAATADVLNQEYQVAEKVSDNVYLVDLRTVSSISSITTTDGLDPTYVFATS